MVYALALAVLLAALYYTGRLTLQAKRAMSYIGTGSFQKRCVGASFTSCSGHTRRIIRVEESRSYSFRLSGHVQQGTVRVTLKENAAPVLLLTRDSQTATVFLEKGKAYRMEVHFDRASGDYQLEWD